MSEHRLISSKPSSNKCCRKQSSDLPNSRNTELPEAKRKDSPYKAIDKPSRYWIKVHAHEPKEA